MARWMKKKKIMGKGGWWTVEVGRRTHKHTHLPRGMGGSRGQLGIDGWCGGGGSVCVRACVFVC